MVLHIISVIKTTLFLSFCQCPFIANFDAGDGLLQYASFIGMGDVVRELMKWESQSVSSVIAMPWRELTGFLWSALQLAAWKGHYLVLKYLLSCSNQAPFLHLVSCVQLAAMGGHDASGCLVLEFISQRCDVCEHFEALIKSLIIDTTILLRCSVVGMPLLLDRLLHLLPPISESNMFTLQQLLRELFLQCSCRGYSSTASVVLKFARDVNFGVKSRNLFVTPPALVLTNLSRSTFFAVFKTIAVSCRVKLQTGNERMISVGDGSIRVRQTAIPISTPPVHGNSQRLTSKSLRLVRGGKKILVVVCHESNDVTEKFQDAVN